MTSSKASFWSGVKSDAYLNGSQASTHQPSRRERSPAPLAEHEQTLVPEHGELLRVARLARLVRVREADEVEDERIDHFVRERVLFVEQDADE